MIIIEGVQSGRERKGEWEREREQERVRESIPNKGKQSAPLRMIVTITAGAESAPKQFSQEGTLRAVTQFVSCDDQV